jgi:hypothetical protein
MAELPRPDDAADALAIAVWATNTWGSGRAAPSPVMDRAAVAPIARGGSGYDRAVREALAQERAAVRTTRATRAAGVTRAAKRTAS